MSSIKNKIDSLEESLSPKYDFAKDLAARLNEARERLLREGPRDRTEEIQEYLKKHPEISLDTDVNRLLGMMIRERLKEHRDG